MEPHIVRLRRPVDVLSYLPYRFGYVPTDSLVSLGVIESSRTMLGTASRLDLAWLDDPPCIDELIGGVADQLILDGAAWSFTIIYTSDDIDDVRAGRGVAGRAMANWLAAFPFAGVDATFIVTPERFGCLVCAQEPCCPDGGHSIERLAETEISAHAVLSGQSLVRDRQDLGVPLDLDDRSLQIAGDAMSAELRLMGQRDDRAVARWRRRMLDSFASCVELVASHQPLRPEVLGRLAAALAEPDFRDVMLVWALTGQRHRVGSAYVRNIFSGVLDGSVQPPQPEQFERVRTVMSEIARHSPGPFAAFALALIGWMAWWQGQGARADVVLRQALEADPGCRLVQLLGQMLVHGVRPGWVNGELEPAARAG